MNFSRYTIFVIKAFPMKIVMLSLLLAFTGIGCSQTAPKTESVTYAREYNDTVKGIFQKKATTYLTRDTMYISETRLGSLTGTRHTWRKTPDGWFRFDHINELYIIKNGDYGPPVTPNTVVTVHELVLSEDKQILYARWGPELTWKRVQP
jgi:hypothetical protein